MTDYDRELGAIIARLTEIERRLGEGDADMRELTRTVTELVRAMAGLTARLSLAAVGSPGGMPLAVPATGAAAVTPHLVSRAFTSSAASRTVSLLSSSTILLMSAMVFSFVSSRRQSGRSELVHCLWTDDLLLFR